MTPAYRDVAAKAKVSLRACVSAATLALATPVSLVRAEDAPAPLTGPAAWARLVGNTVSGTTPDGPYAEFFAPDGTLRIVDGDGRAGGRWTLRDDKVCTKVDDDDEECRALTVTDAVGAFTDDGGTRYPFDILPGNPKGL